MISTWRNVIALLVLTFIGTTGIAHAIEASSTPEVLVDMPGCTDSVALNYDLEATVDDGSCEYEPVVVPGCTDALALNYSPEATEDDASCEYEENNTTPTTTPEIVEKAEDNTVISGCTDAAAINYNSEATEDDASCAYPVIEIEPKFATRVQFVEDVPQCNGEDATIYVNGEGFVVGGPLDGTAFSGTLTGTAEADVIFGTDGDDVINGKAGDDLICGKKGNDTISGKGGSDTIFGNRGDDTIFGNGGADIIDGGLDNDTIKGGNNGDQIEGGDGNDEINGGNGPDVIYGGEGSDTLCGDNGQDEVRGNQGADTICGGDGDDMLFGGKGADSISGDDGIDEITGGNGEDVCDGETYVTGCETVDTEIETCTEKYAPEIEYPYGQITAPTENEVVSGTATLTANYYDNDEENDDAVQWAVRSNSCSGTTVGGNVDGFDDTFSWDGSAFSSDLDTTALDDGTYCFIFNPTDDEETDVRETVLFEVEQPFMKPMFTEIVDGDTFSLESFTGWLFNRDQTTKTPFTFNKDTANIGDGALYVLPIGGENAKDKFIGEHFLYREIADIESIKYDFEIGGSGALSDANEFYLNVYANYGETNPDNFYDCKYDVVPSTGSVGSFTTVTFDPTQSYPVTTRGTSPYTCPAIPADMDEDSEGSIIRMFAINVGDTSLNDAGLDGYYDKVVVDTVTEKTTYDFELIEASLEITSPSEEGEQVEKSASTTFTALYIDDDEDEDTINFAVKAGTCEAGTPESNVAGFGTDQNDYTYDMETGIFSTTVDLSTATSGDYCLVVNPVEGGEDEDLRETRTFELVDEIITYPYGQITAPTENEVVSGTATLTANYYDNDEENDDAVQWAVRSNSCSGTTVGGNVDGFDDTFSWDGSAFSSDLDTTALDDGTYCFIFNPTDDEETDVRETVLFEVEQDTEEIPSTTSTGNGGGGAGESPSNNSDDEGGSLEDAEEGQVLGATTGFIENTFCSTNQLFLNSYIFNGSQNDAGDVALLQLFLLGQGYAVTVTGTYDAATIAAVNQFQVAHKEEILVPWIPFGLDGETPTGNVYQTTRWKINNTVCPGSEVLPLLSV